MKLNIKAILLILTIIYILTIINCKRKLAKEALSSFLESHSKSQLRGKTEQWDKYFDNLKYKEFSPKHLVDELIEEDKYDPNSKPKPVYHDYNHEFEKYSLEEIEKRIYDKLAPEKISYNFD